MTTRPTTTRTHRLAALAAAAAATGALALGGAGTAQAYPSGDPLSSGCASDARPVWSAGVGGATVEVRYSARCGTNWVRITGAGGRASEARIYSNYSNWQYTLSYANSPNQHWTPMVYAPGSTCVTFEAVVQNPGKVTASRTGFKTLC